MLCCLVKNCKNRGKMPGITYHKIPKKNSAAWFDALNRTPRKTFSLRNVVCSIHFKKSDFTVGRKIQTLKPGSVPSLYLNQPKVKRRSCFDTDELSTSHITETVDSVLQSSAPSVTETVVPSCSNSTAPHISTVTDEQKRIPPSKQTIQPQEIEIASNKESSPSDSFELEDSPTINQTIVQRLHNYNKSPEKTEKTLRENLISMRKKLKNVSRSKKRLKHKVSRLKSLVSDLKSKAMIVIMRNSAILNSKDALEDQSDKES